jgi:hypothetical protein
VRSRQPPARDLCALAGLPHRAALGELVQRFVCHDLNAAIFGAVEVPIKGLERTPTEPRVTDS